MREYVTDFPIVAKPEPVCLVGGGVLRPEDLRAAMQHAPTLVAADGGLGSLLAAGLSPDAVIGDFDSVREADLERIPKDRRHFIAEQNSTDFDKALRHIEAPLVIGLGLLGARLDHQFAALNVLVRYGHRKVILVSEFEVVCHLPPQLSVDLAEGDVVSLMPFAPVRGQSTGLKWPIDGLLLEPNGQIGTSNAALGPVRILCDAPGLIAILPRQRFDAVVSTLLSLPPAQHWPAPDPQSQGPHR